MLDAGREIWTACIWTAFRLGTRKSLARHGHSSCPQDNDDFQVIVEAVANPACCLIRYLFQLVESRALLEHNHYFEFITI